MQAIRLAVPALALAVALSSLFLLLGLTTANRASEEMPRTTRGDHRPVAATSPPGKVLSTSTATEDVGGKPIPGLPHHPEAARVGYTEDQTNGVTTARAEYVTEENPEGVRRFYRDVFRSKGWKVANVEYSGGGWYFLVTRGGREAGVEVLAGGGGSRVVVEAQEGGASAGGSKR